MRFTVAWCFLSLGSVACSSDSPRCVDDTQCGAEAVCVEGRCRETATPADGGAPRLDAGTPPEGDGGPVRPVPQPRLRGGFVVLPGASKDLGWQPGPTSPAAAGRLRPGVKPAPAR